MDAGHTTDFHERRAAIVSRATELAGSGRSVLISALPDIRWATGFSGSNALLVLLGEQAHLLTDGRYTAQVAQEAVGCAAHIVSGSLLNHACDQLIPPGSQVIVQPEHLTLSQFDGAVEASTSAQLAWERLPDLVQPLRASKSAGEVDAITAAQRLTERVFDDLTGLIVPGITELDLAAEITYRHLRAGAARMSFDPIVAFGENAALPHGRPSARELRRGDPILVDMGCFLNGYASDMTRMFSLGHPGADFMAAYQTVLDALNRAADAARSGMSSSALDGVARDVIASAGLGDSFSHSLGHGVGLEI
ncbi:MAG: M24 family metallopeptidase, partial [Rhodothermales bacterium]|nr:M24 family metallopeptidase [Rhodothermales bacterium]